MGNNAGVVIVGAGLGGIRVAESVRSAGYEGSVTLIGAEPHPPYDRPPLSKNVLAGKQERPDLKPAEFFADSSIDLRTGRTVVSVDPQAHSLTVAHTDDPGNTETVAYDTLVLATGLTPRAFPGADESLAGLHTLRTIDDALGLRTEIDGARSAVVIGAGFIGCEVAATLRGYGVPVTLVEPAPTPLAAALGEQIGELVTRLHINNEVDVRAGVGVAEIVSGGEKSGGYGSGDRVTAVKLDDGTELPADIVVVGIGSIPVTGFLDGSGIELADRSVGGGIACDAVGKTSADDVYAVGDVANWLDGEGNPKRVEHWNHVVEQALVVAATITGGESVRGAVPYFWSDQYDVKIQVLGEPRADDDVHIVDDDGKKFLAYYSRDGILTAVVGAGKVAAVMKTRPRLMTETPISELI